MMDNTEQAMESVTALAQLSALHKLQAWEIADGVHKGEFTAKAVTEYFLARISQNQTINAYTLVTENRALAEADAVDRKVSLGENPGPLAGVPFSAKNLFDLVNEVTVAGSRINADNAPATADATSIARLVEAGAICLGATNMGEYAYDFTTTNHHYGATRNPLDNQRSAGGSSGGSAASVLADLCKLSLGTDTNGSMRVPASFCGIWGLKPTYGRLSRTGSFPFVTSLDTIGVFSRSVQDAAMAFDAMSGPDQKDPVCQPGAQEPVLPHLGNNIDDLRIARLGGYFAGRGDARVHEAVEHLCSGLDINTMIELPEPEKARAAAFTITATEGGDLHRERLATRAQDFDPATRARFLAGALLPGAWYLQAQRYRAWWHKQMLDLFKEVDVLLAPATPMLAPKLDAQTFMFGDEELALRPNIGVFTQPLTLIGLPVIAAPVCLPGSLPTAVQLIGKPNSEAMLFRLAAHLEKTGLCCVADLLHEK